MKDTSGTLLANKSFLGPAKAADAALKDDCLSLD